MLKTLSNLHFDVLMHCSLFIKVKATTNTYNLYLIIVNCKGINLNIENLLNFCHSSCDFFVKKTRNDLDLNSKQDIRLFRPQKEEFKERNNRIYHENIEIKIQKRNNLSWAELMPYCFLVYYQIRSQNLQKYQLSSINCDYLIVFYNNQQKSISKLPMDSIMYQQNSTYMSPQAKKFSPYIIKLYTKYDQQEEKTQFCIHESIQQLEQEIKAQNQNEKNLTDMINQAETSSQKTKRKRKNKNEKNNQIQMNKKDDGRGGNCIASNISKTLLRIIYATLRGISLDKFEDVAQKYEIKSQKQNTVILINFLYLFSEQGIIEVVEFQKIIFNFMTNLRDSKRNCQKRMLQQPHRAEFHRKNQRMYEKFIKLSESISFPLIKKIKTKSDYSLSLSDLEEIISDTYDRKQRQIEKAISKLKSIILNYEELKDLYNYRSNRNIDSFFEAIQYAYRRNLPKRCKQMKSNAQNVYYSLVENIHKSNENEQYLIFYSVLDVIFQKKEEIWREFCNNVMLKIKYNCPKQEQQKLNIKLKAQVPKIFQREIRKIEIKNQNSDQQNSQSTKMAAQSLASQIENFSRQNLAKMAQNYNLVKKDFHI